MEDVMNRFLLLAVVAVMPALLSQAFAQSSTVGASPLASDSAKQKITPPARTGGLLNTDVTPAQAKQKTAETNRHIVRRDTASEPQR
jgi:hypothetical protein